MAQSRDSSWILFVFLFLLLGAGGGYWFFLRKPSLVPTASVTSPSPDSGEAPVVTTPQFPKPSTVPSGTEIRLEGSTSMVTLNKRLKDAFEGTFPNTKVNTQANGSEKGIQGLLVGQIDVAAISRPLSAQEMKEGLVAVPVATDQIAIAIGNSNPFTGRLTTQQVKDIFQGKITNWSEVGGPNQPIRVINRPAISGTYQAFRELVLNGENFGTTPNITTLDRDATTPLLQALKNDGIGYATADQVVNQQTVRTLVVDGVLPGFSGYPYTRTLYYVYREPPSERVKAFLGYVQSMK